MFGLPCVAAFAMIGRPARYSLALGAVLLAGAFDPGPLGDTLHKERNFFGVVRVTRSPDGKFVRLMHGTAIYGQQRADESPLLVGQVGGVGFACHDADQQRKSGHQIPFSHIFSESPPEYAVFPRGDGPVTLFPTTHAFE